MTRRGGMVAGVLLLIGVLVAGCSGVPTESRPQVIGSAIASDNQQPPVISPAPGAQPRTIVQGFLEGNLATDAHHTAARAFLTPDEASRWNDTSVTIISRMRVGGFDSATSTITVTGDKFGAINADGTYAPDLSNTGQGGQAMTFDFTMAKVDGEWRIASAPVGLLITPDALRDNTFQQRPIYFYDPALRWLVADPRFTNLTNTAQLASWAINLLLAGPRPELQNAVTTEVPSQVEPRTVTVTLGTTIDVAIPGIGSLDNKQTLNRLAAQIAYTLKSTAAVPIRLIDSGPVKIPALNSTEFTYSDFPDLLGPAPSTSLYYIRDGKVLDRDGAAIPGPLGAGRPELTSIALAGGSKPGELRAAGTIGPQGDQTLWVGTTRDGLTATKVRGPLSRPTWLPGASEVWVGDGNKVYRVIPGRAPQQVSLVAATGLSLTGSVRAMRMGPGGTRVAIVLVQPNGQSQVWIGSVLRSRNTASVEALEPITPAGITVVDVAWNDALKLFFLGRAGGADNLYEVQVDGSLLSGSAISGLPYAPDSLTVTQAAPAWVSAGDTLWTQAGDSWTSPGPRAETAGTAPIYVE